MGKRQEDGRNSQDTRPGVSSYAVLGSKLLVTGDFSAVLYCQFSTVQFIDVKTICCSKVH